MGNLFGGAITKEQVQALGKFFAATLRVNEAQEYLNAHGRGARGAPEEFDAAIKQHDQAVRECATVFQREVEK